MKFGLIYLLVIIFDFSLLGQEPVFPTVPDWISLASGHVATGLGIADINLDGWDDIIVANGNDIQRQSLVVYYNNGNGTFPTSPSWQSGDIDYHGHLAVGDINADNQPDVAVSVFLGPGGFSDPGYVKIYQNQGGQLETVPGYQSSDRMFTFSCALGDADGDGDLDLAVAGGQPYSIGSGPYQTYGRVYYNQNGIMDTLPAWQSQVTMGAMDVDFADFDNNGYLDLAFAAHLTPNYIFLANSSGQLHTAPDWSSQDVSYYANSLTIAEVDQNNFPDLIISDNNQLGGSGKFKAYFFDSAPPIWSMPNWLSGYGGYGSAVLASDLDINGRPDLLAGKWWGRVELYADSAFTFTRTPIWTSAPTSVIEAFVLRDVDKDGIYQV
ncbi:MAG: VCBS repeat-containing protein, partial [bacterium]